jgi:hypothetical protein
MSMKVRAIHTTKRASSLKRSEVAAAFRAVARELEAAKLLDANAVRRKQGDSRK